MHARAGVGGPAPNMLLSSSARHSGLCQAQTRRDSVTRFGGMLGYADVSLVGSHPSTLRWGRADPDRGHEKSMKQLGTPLLTQATSSGPNWAVSRRCCWRAHARSCQMSATGTLSAKVTMASRNASSAWKSNSPAHAAGMLPSVRAPVSVSKYLLAHYSRGHFRLSNTKLHVHGGDACGNHS